MARGRQHHPLHAARDGPPRGARRRRQPLRPGAPRDRRTPARGLPGALPGDPRQRPVRGPHPPRATWPSPITEPRVLLRTGTFPDPEPIPRRLRRAEPRAGRPPPRPRRPAVGIDTPERRPVRLDGPAGAPPLPRARHGHPRRPGAVGRARGPLRADRAAPSPRRLRRQPGAGRSQDARMTIPTWPTIRRARGRRRRRRPACSPTATGSRSWRRRTT